MKRSLAFLFILISIFIPDVIAETTTDYQPVDETIIAGTGQRRLQLGWNRDREPDDPQCHP